MRSLPLLVLIMQHSVLCAVPCSPASPAWLTLRPAMRHNIVGNTDAMTRTDSPFEAVHL